jgi:hypothetical protein
MSNATKKRCIRVPSVRERHVCSWCQRSIAVSVSGYLFSHNNVFGNRCDASNHLSQK